MFPKQNTFVRVNSLRASRSQLCSHRVSLLEDSIAFACGKSQLRLAALLNVNRKLLAVFWSLQFSN